VTNSHNCCYDMVKIYRTVTYMVTLL